MFVFCLFSFLLVFQLFFCRCAFFVIGSFCSVLWVFWAALGCPLVCLVLGMLHLFFMGIVWSLNRFSSVVCYVFSSGFCMAARVSVFCSSFDMLCSYDGFAFL